MSEYAVVSVVVGPNGIKWSTEIVPSSETFADGVRQLHQDGWNLLTATAAPAPGDSVLHTLYLEKV